MKMQRESTVAERRIAHRAKMAMKARRRVAWNNAVAAQYAKDHAAHAKQMARGIFGDVQHSSTEWIISEAA